MEGLWETGLADSLAGLLWGFPSTLAHLILHPLNLSSRLVCVVVLVGHGSSLGTESRDVVEQGFGHSRVLLTASVCALVCLFSF